MRVRGKQGGKRNMEETKNSSLQIYQGCPTCGFSYPKGSKGVERVLSALGWKGENLSGVSY